MKRLMAVDENNVEYQDNGQRAIFFARGVLETVKKLRWYPDIIHCQGWMTSIIPILIKKSYNDEPAFTHTKVITSLFSNEMKGSLGNNFKKSLEYKNIKTTTLKDFNDDFNYTELEKLAVAYSDGVIEGSQKINKELLDFTTSKNLPLLKYPGEDFLNAYKDFYEKVYPTKE